MDAGRIRLVGLLLGKPITGPGWSEFGNKFGNKTLRNCPKSVRSGVDVETRQPS